MVKWWGCPKLGYPQKIAGGLTISERDTHRSIAGGGLTGGTPHDELETTKRPWFTTFFLHGFPSDFKDSREPRVLSFFFVGWIGMGCWENFPCNKFKRLMVLTILFPIYFRILTIGLLIEGKICRNPQEFNMVLMFTSKINTKYVEISIEISRDSIIPCLLWSLTLQRLQWRLLDFAVLHRLPWNWHSYGELPIYVVHFSSEHADFPWSCWINSYL